MSIAAGQETTGGIHCGVPASGNPLPQTGDRLTRAEFERRYVAMPNVKKAELIEGIVCLPSPVRHSRHAQPHGFVVGWVTHYMSKPPGLLLGDNGTARLDEDNEPQPDVMLLIPAEAGGSARIDEDDYVSGAPELVCEVSSSTVSIDLHAKKNAYGRNGVKEYLVWRVEEAAVDWFELVDGRYELLAPDDHGRVRSKVFPGLWLDVAALQAGDLAKVFAAVDDGTAMEEHKAFVRGFRRRRQSKFSRGRSKSFGVGDNPAGALHDADR